MVSAGPAKKDTRDSKPRVAAHRARLRALGLRPIEVWALPEHHERIRQYVRDLSNQPQEQEQPK